MHPSAHTHNVRTPAAGRRARILGAVIAATGLALTTVSPAAHADASAPYPVTVTTSIDDGSGPVSLAGVEIVVRNPYVTDSALASGTTGADGSLAVVVDGEESAYVADAVWPGASGDLQSTDARIEFLPERGEPVEVVFYGTYATVSGSITATASGAPVADLSGAALVVSSGGTEVQRLALAADGSFTSGALPTSATADYRLTLVPPTGYGLAEDQPDPNPSFALPAGPTSPTGVDVNRLFALVPEGATPTPTPTPTQTQAPTPAPTPTATPTPTPMPSGPTIEFPDAVRMGTALDTMSEADLERLLAGVSASQPVGVTNANGQVLGMIFPVGPTVALFMRPTSVVTSPIAGVTFNQTVLAAMDLEALSMAAQSTSTAPGRSTLEEQIESMQNRNGAISLAHAALTAVNAYIASPTAATFASAASAVRAAGVTHAFLDHSAATGVAEAKALVSVLETGINAQANTQQTDLLRLQSLTNKRTEQWDLMTAVLKNMQDSRSSIIGNVRSKPVHIGTVEWNRGHVSGEFDLTRVPNGAHHLILNYSDLGVTTISDITLHRSALAATGSRPSPFLGWGVGLVALGLLAILAPQLMRRRTPPA